MSIFNINFVQKAVELIPPDKRMPRFVGWMVSLLSQNAYNHQTIFVDYKQGSTYPQWNSLVGYTSPQRVIYGQSVYECISGTTTFAVPTDGANWRLYQEFFIGVDTRIYFNHQKLVLEYALNLRFSTIFRQPPLISDIYITRNLRPIYPFIVGAVEEESSVVYDDESSEFIIDSYTFATFYNFTIWVPVAVYNNLSVDVTAREKIIRNFVDRYNTAGLLYNIQTY